MKKWNRTVTAILSAVLVFSLAPASVPAAGAAGLIAGGQAVQAGRISAAETDGIPQDPVMDPAAEEIGADGSLDAAASGDSGAAAEETGIDYGEEAGTSEAPAPEIESGQVNVEPGYDNAGESGYAGETVQADDGGYVDQDAISDETTVPVQTDTAENGQGVSDEGYGMPADTAADENIGSGQVQSGEEGLVPGEVVEGADQEIPVDAADGANGEYSLSGNIVGAGEASIDMGDSDTLYADYANRLFYGTGLNPGKKKLKGTTAGRRLEGQNLAVYSIVKSAATEIANGNRDSAVIEIPLESLGLKQTYTTAELGVGDIYDSANGGWQDDNKALLHGAVGNLFSYDLTTVMYSLFADCAYELYWSSGTMGAGGIGYEMYSDNTLTLSGTFITFTFGVDAAYRPESGGENDVDTARTGAAATAAENAHIIVDNAEGMSDYERLSNYRNWICDLVVYNDEAAADMDNYPDGTPGR